MIVRITSLFPLWAILFSIFAYIYPQSFTLLKPGIVYLLGVVMFGMGMTLTTQNFLEVFRRPSVIAIGVMLQYLLMPIIAWSLSVALDFSSALMIGMVLVGSSPGGTASNVICYLARGDVALSITLTTLSTILAVIATPLLSWAYLGKVVDVPATKMLVDVLKIVIVPVAAGVLINTLVGHRMHPIKKIFPLLSIGAIVLIIAIIIALNQPKLGSIAASVLTAVVLHNVLGLTGGYWLCFCMRYDQRVCRTLAIEVGMQNSGLAVALAIKYFTPVAALPGAIFSIWHNLSGSMLAWGWSRIPTKDQ